MKRKYANCMVTIVSLLLLVAAIYQLTGLRHNTLLRQQYMSDLAYSNNIRFGLFNVEKWKSSVTEIIIKKVDELQFDQTLRRAMQLQIENALYELIKQIEIYLNKDKKQGNWLTQTLKSVAYNIVFDADKFKSQVPQWANDVVQTIINESNKEELKRLILEKFNDYMNQTITPSNINVEDYLTAKYGFTGFTECKEWLTSESRNLSQELWGATWFIICCISIIYIIYFLSPHDFRQAGLYFTGLAGVIVLLAGGLLAPMIDIDARIPEINFELLGEPVIFRDQVLFFESKSIMNLVDILITQGDAQTASIGVLVFTFSIIFPTLKILVSVLAYPFPQLVDRNVFTRFFALKSGKWSMADVLVVAIFMSYIGFRSLIGSQVDYLSNIEGVNMLSTHEHTSLQMGFFLFAAFCFGGMAFASYVSYRLKIKGLSHR